MTNWLFMFWGKARAMAVLIILPIAMYSFGGFAPSVDAKLDTKDVERQYEDWKKDRGELVRSTPITPELREKMKKQRESDKKIEQVVNGLRDGQVFPKKEIT
jgi:hypothetical protein